MAEARAQRCNYARQPAPRGSFHLTNAHSPGKTLSDRRSPTHGPGEHGPLRRRSVPWLLGRRGRRAAGMAEWATVHCTASNLEAATTELPYHRGTGDRVA